MTDVMTFESIYKVYYNHTDAGGVVYFAQYSTFCENAKSDMFAKLGFDERQQMAEPGKGFIIRKAQIVLKTPLVLGDTVRIVTIASNIKGASMDLEQTVYNHDTGAIAATNTFSVGAVERGENGLKPTKIPAELKAELKRIEEARLEDVSLENA